MVNFWSPSWLEREECHLLSQLCLCCRFLRVLLFPVATSFSSMLLLVCVRYRHISIVSNVLIFIYIYMVFYQMLFPASAGVISLCPFTWRVMRMWPIAHPLLHSLLTPCMPFLLVTDDVFLSQTVQWVFVHHFFVGLLFPASLRFNWQEWCLSEACSAVLRFPHTSWNDQHNQAIQHAYRLM